MLAASAHRGGELEVSGVWEHEDGQGPASGGTGMRDLGAFARLVRLPAALTVPGDTLAGAAAAGWPMGRRTALLPLSSAFIYWAGMALNDYADRELDAVERPERPIPSGAVSPREALGVAVALTIAGVGVAALAGGRRTLVLALPLVAAVWAYDLLLKPTAAGPVAMAVTRVLDVLMGAGSGSWDRAIPAALTVGTHTLATTILSRDEVHGSSNGVVGSLVVGGTASAAVAAAIGLGSAGLGRAGGWLPRALGAGLATVYVGKVAPAQITARRSLAASDVRRAVGASVIGTIPLQAALVARSGGVCTGLAVAALLPLARRLTRRVSAT